MYRKLLTFVITGFAVLAFLLPLFEKKGVLNEQLDVIGATR